MDIELARTFLAIVETGSFARAADRLNVTQTAVSARIKSLEEQLGRPLFIRNKAGRHWRLLGSNFVSRRRFYKSGKGPGTRSACRRVTDRC